jgi:hypothetical protein
LTSVAIKPTILGGRSVQEFTSSIRVDSKQRGNTQRFILDCDADLATRTHAVDFMRERRQPALIPLLNPVHSGLQWLFLSPPNEDPLQPRRQGYTARHLTAAALEVHLDHPLRMRKLRRRLA